MRTLAAWTGPAEKWLPRRGEWPATGRWKVKLDALCFPGLAAEWGGRRRVVGALAMESATERGPARTKRTKLAVP